jgi:hypothetical protein
MVTLSYFGLDLHAFLLANLRLGLSRRLRLALTHVADGRAGCEGVLEDLSLTSGRDGELSTINLLLVSIGVRVRLYMSELRPPAARP